MYNKMCQKYMFYIKCSTLISLILLLHDTHPPFQFATPYNSLSPSGLCIIFIFSIKYLSLMMTF